MVATEPNQPVRLRPGMGVVLALQWNLPLLLLFWHPWSVFHLTMVANCFLWALGCFVVGRFHRFRALLFRPYREGVPPRWQAATAWMAVFGTATLVAWFFERA